LFSPVGFVTFASHDQRESPVNYSRFASSRRWICKRIWRMRVDIAVAVFGYFAGVPAGLGCGTGIATGRAGQLTVGFTFQKLVPLGLGLEME
jgi:hypothetical protein